MPTVVFAIVAWFTAAMGAHGHKFTCSHKEWVARHMHEQLGWSMKKAEKVVADECKKSDD